MAYDTPKAAHFELVHKDGRGDNSPEGLQARWRIAEKVAETVPCMLHLTTSELTEVGKVLLDASKNLAPGWEFRLAAPYGVSG